MKFRTYSKNESKLYNNINNASKYQITWNVPLTVGHEIFPQLQTYIIRIYYNLTYLVFDILLILSLNY